MLSAGAQAQLSDANFERLRAIVHDETGITIADNRRSMLISRLQPRLRETGEGNFNSYIKRVVADPAEMQELTNRITTNETYFYRTPRVWTHLRDVTIKAFIDTQKGRPMKVWSAAASTGAEAYTLGVILEDTRRKNTGFEYSVLGTDISSRVIDIANEGLYIGRPIARFRREEPALFEAHMVGDDKEGFRVRRDIKRRIKFGLHNLLQPLRTGGPFDAIFLRNVLIYFTPEDQEKILRNIHNLLRPGGTLVIGESETLKNLNADFEVLAPLIYRSVAAGHDRATKGAHS